jgi:uncharacterized membrane protein YdjX (TVP38/TMEM64 family)
MSMTLDLTSNPTEAAPKHRSAKRVVVLLAVLAVAFTVAYYSPVRSWLKDAGQVQHAVKSLGLWIYPVGIIATALLVACGVPRLLLCGVGGMTLGFWSGLLLAECGTVLGYYCVFLFIRWGGREWALHKFPKLQKWADGVKGQGLLGVILLRQVPIHGTLINLGLGISRVKHWHFVLGTAIGAIPESIPATLVGTGLGKGSAKMLGIYLAAAVVAFALIWLGCAWGMRAMRRNRQTAELLARQENL